MKWFGIIALFIPLLSLSVFGAPNSEREWRIVIENNYKRSKKIWGTYEQKDLKTSIVQKKKNFQVKKDLPANMMLKNGKMVLIQPISLEGVTSYKVKEFPYKKKKGKRYQVKLQNGKQEFLDIYKEQLIAVLKKNKIDPKTVDWNSIELDSMNCKSRKRNFNCNIPLKLKTKPNS